MSLIGTDNGQRTRNDPLLPVMSDFGTTHVDPYRSGFRLPMRFRILVLTVAGLNLTFAKFLTSKEIMLRPPMSKNIQASPSRRMR